MAYLFFGWIFERNGLLLVLDCPVRYAVAFVLVSLLVLHVEVLLIMSDLESRSGAQLLLMQVRYVLNDCVECWESLQGCAVRPS